MMERGHSRAGADGASSAEGIGRKIGGTVRSLGQALFATYRLGGRTMLAAPAIAALAILPEMAQYVAEISLGMFESTDAFRAHSTSSLRMGFGYVKLAGLALAIVATARFWAFGSVRAALLVRPAALVRIVLAVALLIAAELPFKWLRGEGLPVALDMALMLTSLLIQAGLTVYVFSVLIEDRAMTLRRAFTDYWPTAIVMTLLFGAAFLPAQALHMMNHSGAIGSPDAVVWALMLFDSLLVGLMAALIGAALFVGYRTGATWRGWTTPPGQLAR